MFEMVFSNKSYDEAGQLYVRLRKDGILLVEEGHWRLSDETKEFATPLVQEAETIAANLTKLLQAFLASHAVDADPNIYPMGFFWSGKNANYYRFNILDEGGDFIVRGRFSAELIANDNVSFPFQVLSLKPPLKPQFDYLEESLLAHMRWAKKMKTIGRPLKG